MSKPSIANINHYVELSRMGGRSSVREDVSVDLITMWRGDNAVITVNASRYSVSDSEIGGDRMSEWQLYPRDAYLGERHGDHRPATDTARSRMFDEARPVVAEWLESDVYPGSESAAYAWGVRRILSDLRKTDDSRDARRAIERFADKLTDDYTAKLLALCDAWDAWEHAFDNTRFPQ